MYNQKGAPKDYTNTPSAFYLYLDENDVEGEAIFGTLRGEVDVVNSYIDIPVTAYYRIGPFEIEGGASMGFLVNSRASGGLSYANTSINRDDNIIFNVEGSFFSDEAGFNGGDARLDAPLRLPTIISTYYNSNSTEPLYRRFDFALIGGIGVFLNNGLFLGARYQHGITDVTRGENDLRQANENRSQEREFNTDDEDYSRSIQVSVGFRF